MYTSVYLLHQNNPEQRKKYQDRWKTYEGIHLKQHILEKLKAETDHDILQKEFEQKKLQMLEHAHDFSGLNIEDENIFATFPDAMKESELAFVSIANTHFKNLNFTSSNISYANLYNVTFTNCLFSYSTFYACELENVTFVNCDFMERNDVRNCRFSNVNFRECFIQTNLFHSCRFDERTEIFKLQPKSQLTPKPVHFNPKEFPELYKGLKNAYNAGYVIKKSRDCYYLERKAITRYTTKSKTEKFGNYFLEIIAGYGIKPLRVLFWMVLLFIIFSLIFISKIGYPDGLLLSTGAYFTNGAGTNHLRELDIFYKSLFILESFLGTVFGTMFVTVMANLWLRER